MNRRDFLVKSTLAGSAILTSDTISANPVFANTQKPKSVVIIGAGLAGSLAFREKINLGSPYAGVTVRLEMDCSGKCCSGR